MKYVSGILPMDTQGVLDFHSCGRCGLPRLINTTADTIHNTFSIHHPWNDGG